MTKKFDRVHYVRLIQNYASKKLYYLTLHMKTEVRFLTFVSIHSRFAKFVWYPSFQEWKELMEICLQYFILIIHYLYLVVVTTSKGQFFKILWNPKNSKFLHYYMHSDVCKRFKSSTKYSRSCIIMYTLRKRAVDY